ncbi:MULTISPECIES: hypothetical protein [unclassified Nostoc]|uniref:hypothetical protein n=1 Tax=unclassified Nostoc TaxID=2593658 RepID=UPI002AD22077|nr:hypothetical protein [Nostoc sp. DedQUE03]MDZ7971952.1 hypothetical protein [Nostoc sp. DedQUE03]MDZ8043755.1 hypothetical protein [Nostoc sp. DedQUE02]
MTIPLFSGDAGRSLLIRSRSLPQGRDTDNYSEADRRQEANSTALASLQALSSFSPAFFNKINNSFGLNAVNLQIALDEVFHVRS